MAMYYGDSNGKAQRIVVTGMQGPAGPQGPQGATGPQGPAGQGVPAGGTAGQVLTQSNDGPVWANLPDQGWSQVSNFTNNYYDLWESGSIRILIPKSTYKLSVTPELATTNIYSFYATESLGGLIPSNHYPKVNASATSEFPRLDISSKATGITKAIVTAYSYGSIYIQVVGFYTDDSMTTGPIPLPAIIYEV